MSGKGGRMGTRARDESRLLRAAPFAAAVACGGAMALAILCAPGRAGAAIAQAAAGAAFAVFVACGFHRLGDGAGPERDGANAGMARAVPGSQHMALWVAVAAAAAAGAATVLALGTIDADAGDGPGAFALGVAGFLAATASFVAWVHVFLRGFARWNGGASGVGGFAPSESGGKAEGDPGGNRRLAAGSALCFAAMAAGLGLCFNMRITPLADKGPWAALCGCAVAAVLSLCGWWLFRTPRIARQIGSLHDRYESAVSELGKTQGKVSALEGDMACLQARHEDALRRGRDLESQVSTLRKKNDELGHPGISDACRSAVVEYGLSKRESDVLSLLARGYSRKRIAAELVVEPSTVNSHVNRLYRKLGVHSVQELIDLLEGAQ